MCIPIFPCISHPTSRPPIRPDGPFPFSNCYQWSGLGMERRVRVATRAFTEYNEGKVASLGSCLTGVVIPDEGEGRWLSERLRDPRATIPIEQSRWA